MIRQPCDPHNGFTSPELIDKASASVASRNMYFVYLEWRNSLEVLISFIKTDPAAHRQLNTCLDQQTIDDQVSADSDS